MRRRSAVLLAAQLVGCAPTPAGAPGAPPPAQAKGDAAAVRGAGVPVDSGATDATEIELTVATYNVNFGRAGDPRTLAVARSLDADVLLLQETHRGWEQPLRRALSARYPHARFLHHRYRPGGLAVFSRTPIEVAPAVTPAAGRFPAWPVVVDTAAGPVRVVNLHLYPPVLSRSLGWVRAYLSALERHRDEIAAIVSALEGDYPTVLAGDFNENLEGGAIRWLAERGYRPAVQDPVPTWQWTTGVGTVRAQLDHVLLDSRFTVGAARVLPGGGSDHQPVVVTLRIAGR